MLDLNEFAKEVHANAVAHGWWEEERPFYEVIALIHSEISEALEEYRAGRPMVWHGCMQDGDPCQEDCKQFDNGDCKCGCREGKPEGIAVELIDMCIRIMDYEAKEHVKIEVEPVGEHFNDLLSLIGSLHNIISTAYSLFGSGWETSRELGFFWLNAAITEAFQYIRIQGLDPEALLLEKHEYNKTRPYKHGGKVC